MADVKKKLSALKTINKKTRAPNTPRNNSSSSDPPPTNSPRNKSSPSQQLSPSAVAADHHPRPHHDVKHPTGDKMRDKVRSLLADALFKKDEPHVSSKQQAQPVANSIEHAMFIMFDGNGQSYKQKYRSISFNLKDPKNGKLRSLVLSDAISPQELLQMSSTELANDELRKRRAKVQEKMTRDAMPYTQQAASTDRFKCGKCKQRKCTYYQMQTRSADEPLTTFVTCVNCNNRWRF